MSSSSSSSPEPGVRSVTLKKGITGTYVEGRTQGYLLRVEVTETNGVDPYLFVFQRINGNDEFSNVASPADLQEYPVGAPDEGGAFFRLHEAELVFRNLTLLENSVNDIEKDIEGLVESLNQLDRLQETTVVIEKIRPEPAPSACDTPLTPESSSSCDSSSSSSSPLRRAVRLQISDVTPTSMGIEQGYRVTVEVIEAIGLPEELFVFQRKTVAQGSPVNDEFSNVASPADLEEYPTAEPDEGSPFFRLATVDLVYRNLTLLEDNLNDLKHDICMLLETLAQMDRLTSEIVVIDEGCAIIGTDPCPPTPIFARLVGDYRDPSPDDDALHGYGIGSVWTNVVTQQTFVLISNTNGNAIWVPFTGAAIKHNFTATTDPTPGDDITQGYSAGSHWYNTVTEKLFICVDNSEGAAVWRPVAATVKYNFTATTDPGVTNGSNEGYEPTSEWYNTVTGDFFVCIDATPGAALWVRATGGGGGGAGLGLYQTPGPKLNVQVDNDSTAITVDNDLVAATPTKIDAEINAIVTAGNDADSGIRITLKPAGRGDGFEGDRYVQVFINGQKVVLGDGNKTKDCFFSDSPSAPYSPKYLADVEPGDKLIWNGLVAKFDLDDEDIVSLHYTTLQLGGSSLSSSSGAPGSSGIWGIGVWGEFVWGQP